MCVTPMWHVAVVAYLFNSAESQIAQDGYFCIIGDKAPLKTRDNYEVLRTRSRHFHPHTGYGGLSLALEQ